MKIHIKPEKPRPTQPAVALSKEAYAALLELSDKHNVSMRKLANEIILKACDNLEVVIVDED